MEQCLMNHELKTLSGILASKNNTSHRTSKYNQLSVDHKQLNNNVYNFGVRFKYTAHHTSQSYTFGNETIKDTPIRNVTPKFSTFKEELTANHIASLCMEQFEREYSKAQLHINTHYFKQTFKKFDDFCIHHLLALMVHCNFDNLQFCFSKTFREDNGCKHNNFYHFGLYLTSAIHSFGTVVTNGCIKSFYHGISQQLIFPYFFGHWAKTETLEASQALEGTSAAISQGVIINCPLSTSSSFEVSTNFTNHNNGLVVNFGWHAIFSSTTKSFDVAWLSDYGNEREQLFCRGIILNVRNITDARRSEE
eukprot:535110_1